MLHHRADWWFAVIGGVLVVVGTLIQVIVWWKLNQMKGLRGRWEARINAAEELEYNAKEGAQKVADVAKAFVSAPSAVITTGGVSLIAQAALESDQIQNGMAELIRKGANGIIQKLRHDLRKLADEWKESEAVVRKLELAAFIFLVAGSSLAIIPQFLGGDVAEEAADLSRSSQQTGPAIPQR